MRKEGVRKEGVRRGGREGGREGRERGVEVQRYTTELLAYLVSKATGTTTTAVAIGLEERGRARKHSLLLL